MKSIKVVYAPQDTCLCVRCGKVMPLQRRVALGKALCIQCSEEVTSPIREISLAATSLHWI